MKTFTIDDIRKLHPCYDPKRYLPNDWKGTLVDILKIDNCPAKDRVWVVVRLMPRLELEIFAIDCAFADAVAVADIAAACAYYAVAADAYYAAVVAAAVVAADADESQRQIDALIWLIENEGMNG